MASVLLVEKTEVSGENNRPLAIHWQTLLRNVISGTPRLSGFQAYNFKHRDCFWTIPIIIFYKIVENTLLLIVEPIVFIIFHCIMLYVSYFIVSCWTLFTHNMAFQVVGYFCTKYEIVPFFLSKNSLQTTFWKTNRSVSHCNYWPHDIRKNWIKVNIQILNG